MTLLRAQPGSTINVQVITVTSFYNPIDLFGWTLRIRSGFDLGESGTNRPIQERVVPALLAGLPIHPVAPPASTRALLSSHEPLTPARAYATRQAQWQGLQSHLLQAPGQGRLQARSQLGRRTRALQPRARQSWRCVYDRHGWPAVPRSFAFAPALLCCAQVASARGSPGWTGCCGSALGSACTA